jgi:hypothetical protein
VARVAPEALEARVAPEARVARVAPEALVPLVALAPLVAPAAREEEPTISCAATSMTTQATHRAEEKRPCTVVPTSDSGVDMSGVGQVNEYVH